MEPFTYAGLTFKPVVRTSTALIAYAPLPDGCCTKVIACRPVPKGTFFLGKDTPNAPVSRVGPNPAIDTIAFTAAETAVLPTGFHPTLLGEEAAEWSFIDDENKAVHVPPFNPVTVPGTSAKEYYAVALTANGVVARREKNTWDTRIRVTGKPGKHLPIGLDPALLVVNEEGRPWETHVTHSHLAHNGKGVTELRALVARGIMILLNAEIKGWT